jgi:hypothetical protein
MDANTKKNTTMPTLNTTAAVHSSTKDRNMTPSLVDDRKRKYHLTDWTEEKVSYLLPS